VTGQEHWVDKSNLTKYLIGSETKIVLPESYWPKDKVSWTTQCMDHRKNKSPGKTMEKFLSIHVDDGLATCSDEGMCMEWIDAMSKDLISATARRSSGS